MPDDSDRVVRLPPRIRLVPTAAGNELEQFDKARQAMIAAWQRWLAAGQSGLDVIEQIDATLSAMSQIDKIEREP